MARMTMRSTFALDPETVSALDELAARWGISKSETLRRIVDAAARVEAADAATDAIAALAELRKRLGLDEEKARAWIREIRAGREGSRP